MGLCGLLLLRGFSSGDLDPCSFRGVGFVSFSFREGVEFGVPGRASPLFVWVLPPVTVPVGGRIVRITEAGVLWGVESRSFIVYNVTCAVYAGRPSRVVVVDPV